MMVHNYHFLCPCTTTWKHVTSSLWMNATNLIFLLLCIHNFPRLIILTPHHSPYTFSVDYADISWLCQYIYWISWYHWCTNFRFLDHKFFLLYFIIHLIMKHQFLVSTVIVPQFFFHLKFWNQYCFDLKIFHPLIFFIICGFCVT